jgi:hypothetical protein
VVYSGYYLYDGAGDFGAACAAVCEAAGLARREFPEGAAVAVAPRLSRKLPRAEWDLPLYGTLVFHPSALPYHRGPDAIRWALNCRERVSAATWFWADDGLDTGDVCEQEPVLLDLAKSAGRNYHERFMPAALVALARAAAGIVAERPRRVPQDAAFATYDGFYVPHGPGGLCPYCNTLSDPAPYHERGDCMPEPAGVVCG